MKSIKISIIFILLMLYSPQLHIPSRTVICQIGQYEQSIYQQFKSNLSLTEQKTFQRQLKLLLQKNPKFKSIQLLQNHKRQTNALILENSSCIQTIINQENNLEAFVFLSNNHHIEWKEIEILENLIRSVFNNVPFGVDIYKITNNIMSPIFSENKSAYYTYVIHDNIQALYILNKQTNQLTVFYFKVTK